MATIRLNVINSESSILRINNLSPDDVSFCEIGGNVGIGGIPVDAKLHVLGNAIIASTTDSSSPTVGAVVVYGGVSISSESDATSVANGGSFTTAGGLSVGKRLYVGSTLISTDSTASSSPSTGALQLSGGISISNTTDAVSATNGGTFTTDGGIAVAKTFYLGGQFVSTATTSSTSISTGSLLLSGSIGISNTTNAASAANGGTFTTAGGIGIAKDVYIGGIFYSENTSANSVVIAGGISISNTTDASSSTNGGTFTTAGGAAIGKSFYVGGTTTLTGPVLVTNTDDATDVASGGALTISGGAAVAKNFYVGNTIFITSTTSSTSPTSGNILTSGGIGISNTTDAVSATSGGSVTTAGGLAVGKSLYVGLTSNLIGAVLITNSTDATSAVLGGALTISGGVGVSKKLFVGSTITSADTTASTSSTTGGILTSGGIGISNDIDALNASNGGSLTTAGGAAVGKSLFVGANSTVAGILSITNTVASTSSTVGGIVSTGGLSISNTTDATDLSNGGGLTVAGGASIAKQIFLGGLATFASGISLPSTTPSTSPSTGSLVLLGGLGINNTTDAVSASNGGSLTTAGGIGVGKSVFVGLNISVAGSIFATGTTASTNSSAGAVISSGGIGISNDTDAVSELSGGSLTTAGGVAIGKKLFIGDTVTAGTTTTGSHLFTTNSTGHVLQIKNTNVGGYSSVQFLDAANADKGFIGYGAGIGSLMISGGPLLFDTSVTSLFANTTDSTSITTGSVVINGGLAIAKNVTIGGSINLASSAPSTSPTTGGLLLTGGIGISNTTDAVSAENGGTFTTAGGAAIGKSLYVGTSGNFLIATTNNGTSTSLPAQQHYTLKASNLNRISLGLYGAESGSDTGSDLTIDGYDDSGVYLNTSVVVYRSTGRVNIIQSTISSAPTEGAIVSAGGIGISNETDAVNVTNGGALTIAGGASIGKKLFVGDSVTVNNASNTTITGARFLAPNLTGGNSVFMRLGKDLVSKNALNLSYTHSTDSSDANYASMGLAEVDDIIKILPINAISIPTGSLQIGTETYTAGKVNIKNAGTGGAIRILPATSGSESGMAFTRNADASVSVSGDYWIMGQNVLSVGDRNFAIGILNGTPSIAISPSGIVSFPTGFVITSTTPSTSPTTGAVTLVGGIGINNSTNAVSAANGGTLTTAGGAAIGRKLFVGETATFTGDLITNAGTSVGGVVHHTLQRSNLPRIAFGLDGLESSGNAGSNLFISRYTDAGTYIDNVLRVDRSTSLVQIRTTDGSTLMGINPTLGDITNQVTFVGLNNVSSPANVTGLVFNTSITRSFIVHLTAVITATVNLYAQFELRGIQTATGWHFTQSFIGDESTGIIFTITNAGQIQYISAIYAGFFSLTMKFRAQTISI